jgi:hypothetical protein
LQPELEIEQIAPELIGSGAQAVVENAKRLGLTWTITLATVTSIEPVEAITDGDTKAIGMVSMIGQVSIGQRIYVIQVPPSGNFICGFPAGGIYRARQKLTTAAAQVVFSNIPATLRNLTLTYRARGDTVAQLLFISVRPNNVSAATYFSSYTQGINVTASAAVQSPAVTWAMAGFIPGASSTAGVFGSGQILFPSWDTTTDQTFNHFSQALGSTTANFANTTGGGVLLTAATWTSLVIAPNAFAGGNFIAGSDFQLSGEGA